MSLETCTGNGFGYHEEVCFTYEYGCPACEALSRLEDMENERDCAQSDLENAHAEIDDLENQISSLQDQSGGDVTAITQERDDLRTELDAANEHIQELEDQLADKESTDYAEMMR